MPKLLLLFLEFFKVGLVSFGGGYAMIPLLKDIVVTHSWISIEEFNDFIGICECTPGPIAVNLATYVGFEVNGVVGSLIATLGVILPSFIIILVIASVLKNFSKYKVINVILSVLKPITIALILGTGINMALTCLSINSYNDLSFDYKSLLILDLLILISLIYKMIFKKKINTVLFIILSALIGIVVCMIL